MGELAKLPNIGQELERQLNEVGITTYVQLNETGTKQVWLEIQKIDESACIHRLLALEGSNTLEGFEVMKKKVGLGTLSFLLVIIALVWSYSIFGFCLGDKILSLLNLPVWSNEITTETISIVPIAGGQSIHYTVFYSLILFIPALILAIKNKNHLLANVGKWMAIIFILLLLVSPFLAFF